MLFEGRKKDVLAFVQRVNGPRQSQRDGLAGIASWGADVRYALNANGLVPTAKAADPLSAEAFKAVMKAIGRRAVAQTTTADPTTGRRVKAHVRVVPVFLVAPPHNTRSGEFEMGRDFMVLKKGWDPKARKWRSIDFRKLMKVTAEAQAAHNQAIGYALRDHGILCVPNGKGISAVGYTAQPQGAARMRAAGAWAASVGPGAAKAAAQAIAAKTPKRVVPWPEALNSLTGTVNRVVTGAVSTFLTKCDETVQVRLAAGAVKEAFGMHQRSGGLRYTEGSVRATAAHLALPHVRPEILDWVWGRMTADPRAVGAKEVRQFPDGTRLFAPLSGEKVERQLKDLFAHARKAAVPGLSQRDVIGTLVTQGLTTDQRRDLYELCGDGGLRWADQYAKGSLERAVQAHEKAGRKVHVVGDPKLAGKLGQAGWSMTGFVDSATRTGHMRSLWLGLRAKGPFGDFLGAAEHVRASKPRLDVKRGDLVVLAPQDLQNARAMKAVMALAKAKGAKVAMTGPAAEQYRTLVQLRGLHL